MFIYRHKDSGAEIITKSELSGDWELVGDSAKTTKTKTKKTKLKEEKNKVEDESVSDEE